MVGVGITPCERCIACVWQAWCGVCDIKNIISITYYSSFFLGTFFPTDSFSPFPSFFILSLLLPPELSSHPETLAIFPPSYGAGLVVTTWSRHDSWNVSLTLLFPLVQRFHSPLYKVLTVTF